MLPESDATNQELCIHELTHYRKTGKSMSLTVPKALRDFLDWKEGELIVITAHQNSLVLRVIRQEFIDGVRRHVEETKQPN